MKINQRSFSGGELSPELHGRFDLAKYSTGLKQCKNFMVLPHGPVANRPGTEFVGEAESGQVRLIDFQFNSEQTYVLVFSHLKIKVIQNGGFVIDPGTLQPVELVTPYAESDLQNLHYVQSADVLTIVHHNYAPKELVRTDHHLWSLSNVSFSPKSTAVTSGSAEGTINAGGQASYYTYQVTAIDEDSGEESFSLLEVQCIGRLGYDDNFNTITWTEVPSASSYKVYKEKNGVFGYIGTAVGDKFVDDNIAPDLSITSDKKLEGLVGSGNHPSEVAYFEQRRWFANTLNDPQKVWATRSGSESNLTSSFPLQADDAMSFTIAARQVNEIRHLVPLKNIICLTSGGEWSIEPKGSSYLSPMTVSAQPQSYIGAANVSPIVSGNTVLYVDSKGGRVRDLGYRYEADGYIGRDVSLLANHLFDGHKIIDWAFEKVPHSVVWAVRDDGVLLGLTYMAEEEVFGWHRHETIDGKFKSVTVIEEGGEDTLYCLVERTVNGQTKNYIEKMRSRKIYGLEDSFFVDSGLQYSGSPVSIFSGLSHLEGKTVSILGDGNVFPQQVVVDGEISIPQSVSNAVIGLPIEADFETLPLALLSQNGGSNAAFKSVSQVDLQVNDSRAVWVGPSFDSLTEIKQRTNEPLGSPIALKTGFIQITISPSWSKETTLCVRQTDPLPLMILSITNEVSVGG